jgi:hypothetical protein
MSCFVMHALFNALGTLLLFGTQMADKAAEKAIPPPGCVAASAQLVPTGALTRVPVPTPPRATRLNRSKVPL